MRPHPSVRIVIGFCALIINADRPAQAQPGPRSAATGKPPISALFFSGHSLLDNPLPDDVIAIAKSLGHAANYNQQNIPGSPIRVRTRGSDPNSAGWAGYHQGKNRGQANMDVLAEIANPQTLGNKRRYDALVITERHDLLSALVWEDSVRYLRHYHDRLIKANPTGTSFFYHSWLGLRNKNDPSDWVAYERAAAPIWGCIATRINQSLQHEGRRDALQAVPANLALAELVDRATQGQIEGISQPDKRQTVNSLFADDVHLTRLGVYYMALVTFASVYQESPLGAWAPSEVGALQANTLQKFAWESVTQASATSASSLGQCGATLRQSFCSTYWNYVKRPDQISACQRQFSDNSSSNPMKFDPATDGSYWFSAP